MDTISIGMMLPTSSIRPMSKDFERAFKKSIDEILAGSNYEVEIIPEMIGNGSHAQIEGVLDKFFGYHDVDIVTGIASNQGIQFLVDRFEKRKVPFICCNLGEHFMPAQGYGDYVFQNSIHLWQQVWLLGYYAATNLGSKGMILSAMYDSGYCFMAAFESGMRAGNPDIDHQLKLLPLPQTGEISAISEGMDVIDIESCDFIFPLFCGEEATLFLEEFKKRGLINKVQLLGLPFLIEAGDKDLSGISIHTINHLQGEIDSTYRNVFKDLGNSTALAIGSAILSQNGKINKDAISAGLVANNDALTYSSTGWPKLNSPIYVQKITFSEGNESKAELLFQQTVNLDDDEAIQQMRNSPVSAWVNPYLGI